MAAGGTFPAVAGYCRVTPAALPPGVRPLPTFLGLWSTVLRRSRADLPVVIASFALLASALSLLAAGTLYTDAVTLAGCTGSCPRHPRRTGRS